MISANKTNNIFYSDDNFGLQISYTSKVNTDIAIKHALEKQLSIVNFTVCEIELKKEYNIPTNMSLIYKKIDFKDNELKNLSSAYVTFSVYNPITLLKLNISICTSIIIAMPFKNNDDLMRH